MGDEGMTSTSEVAEHSLRSCVSRDDFLQRYDRLCVWRSLWLRLACDLPRARRAQRSQRQQERIERRSVIANVKIAELLFEYDTRSGSAIIR